ncbi:hypothetical protein D3C72_2030250 [compost metagenome]
MFVEWNDIDFAWYVFNQFHQLASVIQLIGHTFHQNVLESDSVTAFFVMLFTSIQKLCYRPTFIDWHHLRTDLIVRTIQADSDANFRISDTPHFRNDTRS